MIAFGILLGISAIISAFAPQTPERPVDGVTAARQRAAYQAARAVRTAARDPASVVFERILADENGQTICLTYRARNGFGGMTREHLTMRGGVGLPRASDWNRHCARKAMFDLTGVGRLD
jgi:hypothetical protein